MRTLRTTEGPLQQLQLEKFFLLRVVPVEEFRLNESYPGMIEDSFLVSLLKLVILHWLLCLVVNPSDMKLTLDLALEVLD